MEKLSIQFPVRGQTKSFSLHFDLTKSNHVTVFNHLKGGIFYEPDVSHLMLRILKEGDTFVDIGANQGYFSVFGAALVGSEGTVIAIEPGENNLPDLERNLVNTGLNNHTIFPYPLSDQEEEVSFFLNSDDSGGNALWNVADWETNYKSQANPAVRQLQSKTLNRLLKKVCAQKASIQLIKIDTEGAEEIILRGGLEALVRFNVPYVITELHQFGLQKLGSSQQSLRTLMERMGYECYVLGLKGGMPKYMPPSIEIKAPFIVNLLFCRPGTLAELYPEDFVDPRVF